MKWLADENFDNDILRGVSRRSKEVDIVRVQDIPEIAGSADPHVLAWAAANHRILLTHDLKTVVAALQAHFKETGVNALVIMVPDHLAISTVIEDLLLLDSCAVEDDWPEGMIYLPLR